MMMRAAGGPVAPSGSALAASPAGGGAAPASEGELPIRPRALSVASQKRRRGRRGGAKKRKRILSASPRASAPARPAPDVPSWEICARIARIIQKRTNGIAGNVEGVDGSINATGAACILRSLRVRGRNFVDLGCDYGWMMAGAFGMGALSGVGIELPANIGQMRIYEGVIKKMQEEKVGFTDSFQQKHEFIHLDINEVFALFYLMASLCCSVLCSCQPCPPVRSARVRFGTEWVRRLSAQSCVFARAARHWTLSQYFETPRIGRATRKVLLFKLGSIHPSPSSFDEWVGWWFFGANRRGLPQSSPRLHL
jgi:hypothetical protein